MPGAPTQSTIDEIAGHMTNLGIPSALAAGMFQAIDAAGWTVVTKSGGTPVVSTDTTPSESVAVEGCPGTFMRSAEIGSKGWLVWLERVDKTGQVQRDQAVFVPAGETTTLLG